MKIGLALGEGIVKIGKFLGVQEGFLGITEEAIKKLRGDIEISEEAEKAGESIGEDIVKGIKTGLESLSEEQFKALLDSVKMLGKVEEDEIDMGVIESALTAGKGYGEADSEARQNLDKAVERFDEKMRLMTHSLSTNNEDRLKIDQIYADAEIEIEKLKLSTKADLLTGALAVAGAALQDSAVASLLFSIAQSIASTYLTAQFAAQGDIPVMMLCHTLKIYRASHLPDLFIRKNLCLMKKKQKSYDRFSRIYILVE